MNPLTLPGGALGAFRGANGDSQLGIPPQMVVFSIREGFLQNARHFENISGSGVLL